MSKQHTVEIKLEELHIFVDEQEYTKIKEAAAQKGCSVRDFILYCCDLVINKEPIKESIGE